MGIVLDIVLLAGAPGLVAFICLWLFARHARLSRIEHVVRAIPRLRLFMLGLLVFCEVVCACRLGAAALGLRLENVGPASFLVPVAVLLAAYGLGAASFHLLLFRVLGNYRRRGELLTDEDLGRRVRRQVDSAHWLYALFARAAGESIAAILDAVLPCGKPTQ